MFSKIVISGAVYISLSTFYAGISVLDVFHKFHKIVV